MNEIIQAVSNCTSSQNTTGKERPRLKSADLSGFEKASSKLSETLVVGYWIASVH